jgi:hypothetical protein
MGRFDEIAGWWIDLVIAIKHYESSLGGHKQLSVASHTPLWLTVPLGGLSGIGSGLTRLDIASCPNVA